MKPAEFRRRAHALLEAAGDALRQEAGGIMVKAAAEGSLHSGGTIKQMAGAADNRARALTVALLNDYEAAKRHGIDDEMLQVASKVAIGFANTLQQRCPLDRLTLSDGTAHATDRLFAAIIDAIQEMLRRHKVGLPVEGVTCREPAPGPALLGSYERWVKANPALSSLITFFLGFAVAIAGVLAPMASHH